MAIAKRQCLIMKLFCSSEYIVPEDGEEFKNLLNIERTNQTEMRAMFPNETRPKAAHHHEPQMLYKNYSPVTPYDEREYQDGIRKFKTDDSTPEHICEISVDEADMTTVKHAKRFFANVATQAGQSPRTSRGIKIGMGDVNNPACPVKAKASLDTRNGLTWEEFENAVAAKAALTSKAAKIKE